MMYKSLLFSIVTPSKDSREYIAETIESVISQKGQFRIEYLVVDGGSSDGTTEIVGRYRRLLDSGLYPIKCDGVSISFISKKDSGMYDAINTGFDLANGDIFCWINSDDVYLPGAFSVIAQAFEKYSEVRWIKGVTSYMNHRSAIYSIGNCNLYFREWIKAGVYGIESYFIQQDSVFWRSGLWTEVERIDPSLKRAGDYALWISFATITELYVIKAYVSCFRKHKKQISKDLRAYSEEMRTIQSVGELNRKRIRLYFSCFANTPQVLQRAIFKWFFREHICQYIEIESDGNLSLKQTRFYYV